MASQELCAAFAALAEEHGWRNCGITARSLLEQRIVIRNILLEGTGAEGEAGSAVNTPEPADVPPSAQQPSPLADVNSLMHAVHALRLSDTSAMSITEQHCTGSAVGSPVPPVSSTARRARRRALWDSDEADSMDSERENRQPSPVASAAVTPRCSSIAPRAPCTPPVPTGCTPVHGSPAVEAVVPRSGPARRHVIVISSDSDTGSRHAVAQTPAPVVAAAVAVVRDPAQAGRMGLVSPVGGRPIGGNSADDADGDGSRGGGGGCLCTPPAQPVRPTRLHRRVVPPAPPSTLSRTKQWRSRFVLDEASASDDSGGSEDGDDEGDGDDDSLDGFVVRDSASESDSNRAGESEPASASDVDRPTTRRGAVQPRLPVTPQRLATPDWARTAAVDTPSAFALARATPRSGAPTPAQFRRTRDAHTRQFFAEINERVFGGRLPADLEIQWSKKMRKTAGMTYCRLGPCGEFLARIELSEKVLDSTERLRRTLAHELCHVAAWVINHTCKPPHGAAFRHWGAAVERAYDDIEVDVYHNYVIACKYNYRCLHCNRVIGRHSKSLNTETKRCGACGGRFELVSGGPVAPDGTPAKPRAVTGFAAFVKEHFAAAKRNHPALSQGELMRVLSQEYRSIQALSAPATPASVMSVASVVLEQERDGGDGGVCSDTDSYDER